MTRKVHGLPDLHECNEHLVPLLLTKLKLARTGKIYPLIRLAKHFTAWDSETDVVMTN